jgi:hypothetical protein
MASIHSLDDVNTGEEPTTNAKLVAYNLDEEDFTDPIDQANYEEYLANYVQEDEEVGHDLSPLRECYMVDTQKLTLKITVGLTTITLRHTHPTIGHMSTPASRLTNRSRIAFLATLMTWPHKKMCFTVETRDAPSQT